MTRDEFNELIDSLTNKNNGHYYVSMLRSRSTLNSNIKMQSFIFTVYTNLTNVMSIAYYLALSNTNSKSYGHRFSINNDIFSINIKISTRSNDKIILMMNRLGDRKKLAAKLKVIQGCKYTLFQLINMSTKSVDSIDMHYGEIVSIEQLYRALVIYGENYHSIWSDNLLSQLDN